MSVDLYLQNVLAKYQVNQLASRNACQQIVQVISKWAGTQLNDISFSGSYAKGTAVAGGTDIDIFISLKASTSETLKGIYDKLFNKAAASLWWPRRQNVSIGVTVLGAKVDLVPGKRQAGYQNYHSLYKNKTRTWTQTNVALHIDKVANSGRRSEIRLVKIWRNLHNLDFPSFYLELAVINALGGRRIGDLSNNFQAILLYLRDGIERDRYVDPSNTNNIISDDLTATAKKVIAVAAGAAAAAKSWNSVVW